MSVDKYTPTAKLKEKISIMGIHIYIFCIIVSQSLPPPLVQSSRGLSVQ